MEEQVQTITIDGQSYDLTKLSPDVHRLLNARGTWIAEQEKIRLELAKTEFAVAEITRQLIIKIKAEAETWVDEAPVASEDAVNNDAVAE
jgi:hypothetical protein